MKIYKFLNENKISPRIDILLLLTRCIKQLKTWSEQFNYVLLLFCQKIAKGNKFDMQFSETSRKVSNITTLIQNLSLKMDKIISKKIKWRRRANRGCNKDRKILETFLYRRTSLVQGGFRNPTCIRKELIKKILLYFKAPTNINFI